MRVLINALSARRGGIVTYTRNVTAALVERGVDVVVAAPSNLDIPIGDDRRIRIDVADYPPLRRAVWEQVVWRRVVSRAQPDVLFSSANYALLRSPVPQVLLIREGGLFDPFYLANIAPEQGMEAAVLRNLRRRLMIWSARRSDKVFTPSETTRDHLLLWAPGLAAKLTANYYGAPIGAFPWRPIPEAPRRDEPIRLLYVSVYYPHKAPHVLVRAVDRLNREGFAATATISMTVDEIAHRPGGALDRLTIESAACRDRIRFGSHDYDTLPELYHEHDVFVFPSINETFGHPMAEAMSAGIPIVAADTPINREICGDAALYFTPFSDVELCRQIRVVAADAALRARLVDTGHRRVESLFRWEGHVDRLIGIFEAAIAGGARR